jgi:hypothetical protein
MTKFRQERDKREEEERRNAHEKITERQRF